MPRRCTRPPTQEQERSDAHRTHHRDVGRAGDAVRERSTARRVAISCARRRRTSALFISPTASATVEIGARRQMAKTQAVYVRQQ